MQGLKGDPLGKSGNMGGKNSLFLGDTDKDKAKRQAQHWLPERQLPYTGRSRP